MSGNYKFLCLEGDGIGPEIMASCLQVLDVVRPLLSKDVEVQKMDIGFAALAKSGSTIPDEVIEAAKNSDGVLLGPVSHNDYPPVEEGGLNPSGVLRKALSLYANIRPARRWAGCEAPLDRDIDLVVMRENLEGFYADRNMHQGNGEFMPVPDVALSMRRITKQASTDIAKAAFAWADRRPVKKVTAIHKANVMRLSDGLFLEAVREVARQYPHIGYDEMLVDAAAAHLVRAPEQFDVLVTTNMFGDILSDLASEISGSLGLAGSLNAGSRYAAAQAQHGSAPDIAGQDKANPVSLILSLSMLLSHLGETGAAIKIEQAIAGMLSSPQSRTADCGGVLSCSAFTSKLTATLSSSL